MKRNKGSKKARKTIPIWTFTQAKEAVPYLASVLRSVRENRIEALVHDLKARRLATAPGRPGREALIAHEEAVRDARRADDTFQDGLGELAAIGVYCLDPVAGIALVPFLNQGLLAWFLFDLFDLEPLQFWRYHDDGPETKRPIAEIREGPAEEPMVA